MKKLPFMVLFIIWLQVGVAYGNDQPIVRASLSPEEVVVGSEITLTITVLVPTWFSKSSVYPSMEIESVVTVLPPDSTYPMSEMHKGSSWSGITREYKLYPLGTGEFTLRKQLIGVTYADPQTRKPISSTLSFPELRFTAVVPAGADNLTPFLSGSSLMLTQKLSREADIYRPGDAVERHIVARLEGMPSLFLPPLLSQNEEEGIAVYLSTPSADDEYVKEKKSVIGFRRESATYVFDRGGTYTFPSITLRWWNSETEQVEKAEIPPLVFQVKKSCLQYVKDLPRIVVSAVFLVALGSILSIIYFRKCIRGTLISTCSLFFRSESYVFLRTILRILFRNSRIAYLEVLRWQRKIGNDYITSHGPKSLIAIFELERSIYGSDSRRISFGLALRGKLVLELIKLRSNLRAKQRLRGSGVGSLNPT